MTHPEKVFLDTSFLSRPTDLRVKSADADAYVFLAKEKASGRIEFVVANTVKREMERTSRPERRAMLAFIYWLIPQVAARSVIGTVGGLPIGAAPIGGNDVLYESLCQIFPDSSDAEHIASAHTARCSYFLTLDRKSILRPARKHRSRVQRLCPGLEFGRPRDLARKLQANP